MMFYKSTSTSFRPEFSSAVINSYPKRLLLIKGNADDSYRYVVTVNMKPCIHSTLHALIAAIYNREPIIVNFCIIRL